MRCREQRHQNERQRSLSSIRRYHHCLSLFHVRFLAATTLLLGAEMSSAREADCALLSLAVSEIMPREGTEQGVDDVNRQLSS